MIKISEVNKYFSGHRALHQISLSLEGGKSYAILGANGAGKTTLIKSIMGLVSVDAGEITKTGTCAYLPEQPYLPQSLSAWQMVVLAIQMHGGDKSLAGDYLSEVRLQEASWHKSIKTYSKGMKQRTAIAFALAGNPDWIILDEPMSGLDAMGRRLILDLFRKKNQEGMGILMCSHLVSDIVRLCSEVFIIVRGEVKETIMVGESTLAEADKLENRLQYWSGSESWD